MEGINDLPPPVPPSPPAIGESGKVRSIMDMIRIAKILALVIGIIGFVIAAWYFIWLSIIPAIYFIITAVINLLIYMRCDEFTVMVKSRRYQETRDILLVWMILGIIFGFIAGLLLLIAFIYLDELVANRYSYGAQPPAPPPPVQ